MGWDSLGDAHDHCDAGGSSLQDGVAGKGGRHEDQRGIGPGLFHRQRDGVEDRYALHVLPALARPGPRHHLGAVVPVAKGVERPLPAGEALHHDAGGLIDEDGHLTPPPSSPAPPLSPPPPA